MPASRRVLTHEQVVRAGVRCFIAQSRLDIEELAKELSVGRATLYRAVGGRERLLGDVLDSLSVQTMSDIVARHPGQGVDWLLDVMSRYRRAITSFGPLTTFMREDPELAFRVLFMPQAGLHSRSVARWRDLIEQAGIDGLSSSLDDIAFVFVRIGESMLFTDLFAGREPNLELSMRLLRSLLSPC